MQWQEYLRICNRKQKIRRAQISAHEHDKMIITHWQMANIKAKCKWLCERSTICGHLSSPENLLWLSDWDDEYLDIHKSCALHIVSYRYKMCVVYGLWLGGALHAVWFNDTVKNVLQILRKRKKKTQKYSTKIIENVIFWQGNCCSEMYMKQRHNRRL